MLTEPAEVDSDGEQDWESDEHESATSEQDSQASQEKATMYQDDWSYDGSEDEAYISLQGLFPSSWLLTNDCALLRFDEGRPTVHEDQLPPPAAAPCASRPARRDPASHPPPGRYRFRSRAWRQPNLPLVKGSSGCVVSEFLLTAHQMLGLTRSSSLSSYPVCREWKNIIDREARSTWIK